MTRMADFSPRVGARYWPVIGEFVTAAVRETAAASTYNPRDLFAAATPLVLWGWQSQGWGLKREIMFSVESIEEFIAMGLPQYRSNAGRNTLRSRLLRISETVLPDAERPELRPLGRSDSSAPYSGSEVTLLLGWALNQQTFSRQSNADALLALGLGAGLAGREILALTTDQVQISEQGVDIQVAGDREREVRVLASWETRLVRHVTHVGSGYVFRQGRETENRNLINDFIARDAARIPLSTRRMHATWLVHHLNAGTPLVALLRAAGLSSPEALDRFLRFVPIRPNSDRIALRDAIVRPE
jgi:hypothetical protein